MSLINSSILTLLPKKKHKAKTKNWMAGKKRKLTYRPVMVMFKLNKTKV